MLGARVQDTWDFPRRIAFDRLEFVHRAKADRQLLVEVSPHAPRALAQLINTGIEGELAAYGGAQRPAYVPEDPDAIVVDQLYRARLVGLEGIALDIHAPHSDGFDAQDLECLGRWLKLSQSRPVSLCLPMATFTHEQLEQLGITPHPVNVCAIDEASESATDKASETATDKANESVAEPSSGPSLLSQLPTITDTSTEDAECDADVAIGLSVEETSFQDVASEAHADADAQNTKQLSLPLGTHTDGPKALAEFEAADDSELAQLANLLEHAPQANAQDNAPNDDGFSLTNDEHTPLPGSVPNYAAAASESPTLEEACALAKEESDATEVAPESITLDPNPAEPSAIAEVPPTLSSEPDALASDESAEVLEEESDGATTGDADPAELALEPESTDMVSDELESMPELSSEPAASALLNEVALGLMPLSGAQCVELFNHRVALSSANGAVTWEQLQELYRSHFLPAQHTLLDHPEPDTQAELLRWSEDFEQGYATAFAQLCRQTQRPSLVVDVPKIAFRVARAHGAKSIRLALIDGMRQDIGVIVREKLSLQLDSEAECLEHGAIWAALPSRTGVQLELLAKGADGLRHLEASYPERELVSIKDARQLRGMRVGPHVIYKLDAVEVRRQNNETWSNEELASCAAEVAVSLARFIKQQKPGTLTMVFGDHGFRLEDGRSAGASPEEVFTGYQVWLRS